MNKIVEVMLGVVVLLGAIIAVISALGLIRLQDVYLRSHAATKSATLGVLFILSGVFLYFWIFHQHFSLKLLLGILFVFLTSPVAGHLNARAAYRSGVALWKGSVKDDLKAASKSERREVDKDNW
ncbi:monovalent cation/H(+) antiporter subunit G [Paenibacillus sp. CAU 1782]